MLGHAGSPIAIDLIEAAHHTFPAAELAQFYGATETASIVTCMRDEQALIGTTRIGSCGRAVPGVAVKEAAFPFDRFDVDTVLGPEMRSTGEVMGFDDSFGVAFAKAQVSAGNRLPESGKLIVTVNERDRKTVTPMVRRFRDLLRVRTIRCFLARDHHVGLQDHAFQVNAM